MLLAHLARVSRDVAATPARSGKIEHLAGAVRAAGDDVAVAVSYLSGELRQRRTGVGWATLRDLPSPAPQPGLELAEVDRAFQAMADASGAGSTGVRRRLVGDLFARATEEEQRFLVGLVMRRAAPGGAGGGDGRRGRAAAAVPVADLRRAVMLAGDLPRWRGRR